MELRCPLSDPISPFVSKIINLTIVIYDWKVLMFTQYLSNVLSISLLYGSNLSQQTLYIFLTKLLFLSSKSQSMSSKLFKEIKKLMSFMKNYEWLQYQSKNKFFKIKELYRSYVLSHQISQNPIENFSFNFFNVEKKFQVKSTKDFPLQGIYDRK